MSTSSSASMDIERDTAGHCGTDLARQIFSQYELFHRIFEDLPAKNLNTCSLVCKDWQKEILKIKKVRKKFAWMVHDESTAKHHGDVSTILKLGQRIQNLPSEPSLVIMFSSLQLHEQGLKLPSTNTECRHPRNAKFLRASLSEFLRNQLPISCQIHGIVTSGVVGTDEQIGSPMELEKYNAEAAALLFLTKIPEVDIYTFTSHQNSEDLELQHFAVSSTEHGGTPEVPSGAIERLTGIPDDKKVRFVMYFKTHYELDSPHDLSYALMKQYGQIVVAGGYVDHFIPDDEDALSKNNANAVEPSVKGIAFCGEDIEVASVVLRNGLKNKPAMKAELTKLRDTGIRMNKNTVAFMFACIGMGHHLHNNVYNVESDIFKQIFPSIPLFGFFGNGEIGYNYLPDYSRPDKDANYNLIGKYPDVTDPPGYTWDMPEIYLSYSSVFVLLSLPMNT